MNKVILKLRSEGLLYNDKSKDRIENEVDQIGYLKLKSLLKHNKNIDIMIEIFVADQRISRFFWRHIRRIETNIKAKLINYFIDLEENNFIDSKDKINKNFANKFTFFESIENNSTEIMKRNKKILSLSNRIISDYLKKNKNKDLIHLINKLSLGKLVDFITILSPEKNKISQVFCSIKQIRNLVELRNKISHYHLLLETFNTNRVKEFWDYILFLSEENDKTIKNKEEFNELIKKYCV